MARARQRGPSRPASGGDGRAFTLIEILTAAVLLSFLVIPVVNLILSSSANIRRGATSTQALLLAQAHLERRLLEGFDDLDDEPETRVEKGRFRLAVEVKPFEGKGDVKEIGVWVRWTDGASGKDRAIVLRTLRCRREGQ